MKKLVFLSFLLLNGHFLHSQVITFEKEYPIWCSVNLNLNNFQQTSDGGYILCAGAVADMDTISLVARGYLVKMDMLGQTQWIKSYPKTEGEVKCSDGNSVFQTSDGGYIIGTATYSGSVSSILLIKTDTAGNLVWSKKYPGVGTSLSFCVKQTTDLGYIVCGGTYDTIQQLNYTYLLKTDVSGTPQWGKTFAEAAGQSGYAYCVNQTSDGGYILTGDSYSGAFVIKTDTTGTILWFSNFGVVGTSLQSIKQTNDGGYIATGFDYTNSVLKATLSKFDVSGSVQWQQAYSSTSNTSYDQGFAIEEVSGGYIILDRTTGNATALIKTDMAGNSQWCNFYTTGHSRQVTALDKTTDGGYAFVNVWKNTYMANPGIAIHKTDSLGFMGCGDSILVVQDAIYAPQPHPGFITGNSSPSANHPLSFNAVFLDDSIFCFGGQPDDVSDLPTQNPVTIYPNPSSGSLFIELNSLNGNTVRIEVYDLLGQMVLAKTLDHVSGNFRESMDISAMANGVYFVSVKLDGRLLTTKKIIKGD